MIEFELIVSDYKEEFKEVGSSSGLNVARKQE